jgi:tetratricopeptide (TPR) repeat protein
MPFVILLFSLIFHVSIFASENSVFVKEIFFEQSQSFGQQGDGINALKQPTGLTVDHHGNVYIADSTLHKVLKFTPDSKLLSQFDSEKSLQSPAGIAITKEGNLAISDSSLHRIIIVDQTEREILRFGEHGTAPGLFSYPKGIAIHPQSGNIFVADYGNLRVQEFSPDGTYIKPFLFRGSALNLKAAPRSLSIFDNELFVLYSDINEIGVFHAKSGQLLRTISNKTLGKNLFVNIKDLSINPEGYLFISDSNRNSILILNQKGEFQDEIGGSQGSERLHEPESVFCDTMGNLYISEGKSHQIRVFPAQNEYRMAKKALELFRMGQMDETLNLCRKILDKNPQNKTAVDLTTRVLRFLSSKYLSEQKYEEAKSVLKEFLKFNPSSKSANSKLRLLRWKENRYWLQNTALALTCILLFLAGLYTFIECWSKDWRKVKAEADAKPETSETDEKEE